MTDQATTPEQDKQPDNLHYLPVARSAGTVERTPGGSVDPATGPVLDAELVSEDEYRTHQRQRALARYEGYRHDALAVVYSARRVATHERTVTAAKVLLREGLYVVGGVAVVARRVRGAHSNSRYDRLLVLAEAEKNWDRLAEWETRLEQAKQARHDRAMNWLNAPAKLAKAATWTALSVLGMLLGLGVVLAVTAEDAAMVLSPLAGMLGVVRWVWWFLAAYGLLVLYGGTGLTLLWLRHQGRRHAGWEPAWARTPAQKAESFAIITEDLLTRALAHCKVPALSQALKRGERLEYVVTPRQQGGGTYAQVRLPLGVVAADFLGTKQVELLAGNLGRHKHEVYPQRQPDADARVLDVWIADQGTMDQPAPPWPLADTGEFDVFRDRVPWGVTLRGEPVSQGMLNRHGLTGAVSKQGKTATLRIPALALALDPTVELRIADLKGDGDWSMFRPRAATLIEGGAVEQAEATCVMLADLVTEMQRRYDTKRAKGIRGAITRELSRRPGSGFHPIYAFVDECQVLYQAPHPVGGTKDDARAWRAARRLHDQARAVNIHLWQATQRPDPTAIPAPVREGAHVRLSLYVPNQAAARMVLADAADMGARPQDLRMGRDAGTVVATGEFDDIADGMAFLIVKTHYVSTEAAYPVIDRAMAILAKHGRTPTPGTGHDTEPARDHLADTAAVLTDRGLVHQDEVVHLLAARWPEVYRTWTPEDLRDALPDSARPYKTRNGTMHVSEHRVHEALTTRTVTDSDQPGGGGDPAGT